MPVWTSTTDGPTPRTWYSSSTPSRDARSVCSSLFSLLLPRKPPMFPQPIVPAKHEVGDLQLTERDLFEERHPQFVYDPRGGGAGWIRTGEHAFEPHVFKGEAQTRPGRLGGKSPPPPIGQQAVQQLHFPAALDETEAAEADELRFTPRPDAEEAEALLRKLPRALGEASLGGRHGHRLIVPQVAPYFGVVPDAVHGHEVARTQRPQTQARGLKHGCFLCAPVLHADPEAIRGR